MPGVIAELAALPPKDPATRAQLDQLALAFESAYDYSWHAWHACGSVPVPTSPATPKPAVVP